jgi:prepilin peptidase CpaA
MLAVAQILIQAVVIALLARIAVVDFKTLKIANRDVLALAALGLGLLILTALWRRDQLQTGVWWHLWMSLAVAAALFVVLLPFWFLGKVGAGDVKLMAAVPLVAGAEGMLPFALLLLVFVLLTVTIVKNPLLLPGPLFKRYVEHLDRKGVVPFGTPIAAALIGSVLLRIFAPFNLG